MIGGAHVFGRILIERGLALVKDLNKGRDKNGEVANPVKLSTLLDALLQLHDSGELQEDTKVSKRRGARRRIQL